MDFAIAVVDLIGVIAFFLAFYFSHYSYRQTQKTAGYWLVFSIAMMLGFFWSIMVAFQWLDIFPSVMNEFQQPLLVGSAVTLSLVARLTYDGLVKPVE